MFGQDPPQTCSGTYPSPPDLSIKFCLDMTSFGNVLILFIAMPHAGCGLKQYCVTKNSADVLTQACTNTYPPNMFGHVPFPTPCQLNSV